MGGGPVGTSLARGRAKTAGQAQERLVAPVEVDAAPPPEEEAGLEARTLTPTLALTLTLSTTGWPSSP